MANERIRMGNDELILYIRKNFRTSASNSHLGRQIWEWLRDNADGTKTQEDRPCDWGSDSAFTGEFSLPRTATQFEFRTSTLPDLYQFLDQLGRAPAA